MSSYQENLEERKIEKDDVIIRPMGVWDTRVPLYRFIQGHRKENEIYYSLILAITHTLSKFEELSEEDEYQIYFNHEKHNWQVNPSLTGYRNSFEDVGYKEKPIPKIKTIKRSLNESISSITEYAIVSYFGLFETFIQCWALNYLLARQETNDKLENGWTKKERTLANRFDRMKNCPNWVDIYNAVPEIEELLKEAPHIFSDPQTKVKIDIPITSDLNAFKVIDFWREWRNLLVHRSGIVTPKFYNKYRAFWDEFRQVKPNIKPIEKNKRLSLNVSTFSAMTTPHYRGAMILKDWLVKLSNGQRGHLFAPNPPRNGYIPNNELPSRLPVLLMRGDHENSLLTKRQHQNNSD